jgi:hypothetical protein
MQQCDYSLNLLKEHTTGSQLFLAHLLCVDTQADSAVQGQQPQVQFILDRFKIVFTEPTCLPPSRDYDHRITLNPNSTLNLRSYRFSYAQKQEIEKNMFELLQNYFIQPSVSPYASPVLLVKKKDGSWHVC